MSSEHARLLYDLQESETASSGSSDETDSDISSSTAARTRRSKRVQEANAKRRVSIMTNQYFDIPPDEMVGPAGRHAKRKFFRVPEAHWDDRLHAVLKTRETLHGSWYVNGTGPHLNGIRRTDEDENDMMDGDDSEDSEVEDEMVVDS